MANFTNSRRSFPTFAAFPAARGDIEKTHPLSLSKLLAPPSKNPRCGQEYCGWRHILAWADL